MGYTTEFTGSFKLSRKLTKEEADYITAFSYSRRMKRDVKKLMEKYKGKGGLPQVHIIGDDVAGLISQIKDLGYHVTVKPDGIDRRTPEEIYGVDGEFFVGSASRMGEDNDGTVIDHNRPPSTQPGLWAQWIVGDEDDIIEWDGGEKFYYYDKWLKYYIENFFKPWGIVMNGEVEWDGEDRGDIGKLVVTDNVLEVKKAHISY